MGFDKNALLLYAVTDRSWLNGKSLAWQVEESLKGGVTMVQLREKGLGAVFPTGTKDDAGLMDIGTVKAICAEVNIPCVAIGGINSGNVIGLAGCGLAGVSVVSAIYAQDDIRKAAQTMREASEEMLRT